MCECFLEHVILNRNQSENNTYCFYFSKAFQAYPLAKYLFLSSSDKFSVSFAIISEPISDKQADRQSDKNNLNVIFDIRHLNSLINLKKAFFWKAQTTLQFYILI